VAKLAALWVRMYTDISKKYKMGKMWPTHSSPAKKNCGNGSERFIPYPDQICPYPNYKQKQVKKTGKNNSVGEREVGFSG
jgi:hypothetical protein